MTAPPSTATNRRLTARWIVLGLLAIVAIAALSTYLTAPRPGGRMDPAATSPDGAHALVALLRDQGVDVVVANSVADAERASRPDSLLLVAQTFYLYGDDNLRRLADIPGDRLIVEPLSRAREVLTPAIRLSSAGTLNSDPDCDLPEATRAGTVRLDATDTYDAVGERVPVTRCYGGAVVRYLDGGRTVTVVGTADFMTNSTLLQQGNAALAMNLAGARPRVIWYAPQQSEGESSGTATIFDMIPDQVTWIVVQLCLVVGLVALWQGRRLGPLIAEKLPVVVRASETVEGRGRLYRSRRARDRAADALRTATLQRLLPRLGLGVNAPGPTVVSAITQRCGGDAEATHRTLFGPPPATDADLVDLAHALDDIERQVVHS